jgi:hypothetical protein
MRYTGVRRHKLRTKQTGRLAVIPLSFTVPEEIFREPIEPQPFAPSLGGHHKAGRGVGITSERAHRPRILAWLWAF